MWCPHCADRSSAVLAQRSRVLQLLALIEHPDALPRDAALRIAGELLCWLDADKSMFATSEATPAPLELELA